MITHNRAVRTHNRGSVRIIEGSVRIIEGSRTHNWGGGRQRQSPFTPPWVRQCRSAYIADARERAEWHLPSLAAAQRHEPLPPPAGSAKDAVPEIAPPPVHPIYKRSRGSSTRLSSHRERRLSTGHKTTQCPQDTKRPNVHWTQNDPTPDTDCPQDIK